MAIPTLLVFAGGLGDEGPERLVRVAQEAATLDLLDRAIASGGFDRVILATDSGDLAAMAPAGVVVEVGGTPFHFGRSLRALVERHRISHPFYFGGASAPLMPAQDLAALAARAGQLDRRAIANNLFSCDWIGFAPPSALATIPLPEQDNPLGLLLRDQAGYEVVTPPRSAATLFDIDTPTDLLILANHPAAGPRARAAVVAMGLDDQRLRAAMAVMTDYRAELLVAGRVGSPIWAYLEAETACRVRLFSEERGMRSHGREARGEARTILGHYLAAVGPERFFESLAELGNAALIDTRVLFHHFHLDLSAADRFNSDLGRPDEIENPFVRAFTRAALAAPIPVVLGGHSLVAGGLWAAVEGAWWRKDPPTLDACTSGR
ncbi:MAG: hypothetical protein HY331_12360 [Chloroflexi bacterium]|nr:hypothetical protein [Chloroflexota bacterium]